MVRSANLTGSNPFHADMAEAAELAKPCFLLNVVADGDFNIIRAFAGDYIEAHAAACKLVDDIDGVYVEERTPLVIASAGGYPKDINLYQTSKTLSNARAVVADGGTMILLSECRESFGDADCARQICGFDNMLDRERDLRENFSIGAYVGFLLLRERGAVPVHHGDRHPEGEVRQYEDPRGQNARGGARAREGAQRRARWNCARPCCPTAQTPCRNSGTGNRIFMPFFYKNGSRQVTNRGRGCYNRGNQTGRGVSYEKIYHPLKGDQRRQGVCQHRIPDSRRTWTSSFSGRYTIDAKSIMGIFSIDLAKPIEVIVHGDNEARYAEALKAYII